MTISELRQQYHDRICTQIVRVKQSGKFGLACPNFSDSSNRNSIDIGCRLLVHMGHSPQGITLSGQTTGSRFEKETQVFLEKAFSLLNHLRPGEWEYSLNDPISRFEQYEHLAALDALIDKHAELATAIGTDYIVKPDIVISKRPISDADINKCGQIVGPDEPIASHTPLRLSNSPTPDQARPLLLASISCKWTLRSDRAQNPRTEALNLIRNRKGQVPHIVVVTAEPLPTRIASIAMGTGDLDCVYHLALPELEMAIVETKNEDQLDMLRVLKDGRRLRDISDLPFDLAI